MAWFYITAEGGEIFFENIMTPKTFPMPG